MLIDLTTTITPALAADAQANPKKELAGHLGTHFDVMEREFPLEYTRRSGVVFDVRAVGNGEIDLCDVDLSRVEKDSFVAFCTGYIESEPYGSRTYFSEHPQLSYALIEALVERGVSMIALDFAGVRRGKEHTPTDRACAEKGVFIVENLCNLAALLPSGGRFVAHTYPMKLTGLTGLPCRVIAEL